MVKGFWYKETGSKIHIWRNSCNAFARICPLHMAPVLSAGDSSGKHDTHVKMPHDKVRACNDQRRSWQQTWVFWMDSEEGGHDWAFEATFGLNGTKNRHNCLLKILMFMSTKQWIYQDIQCVCVTYECCVTVLHWKGINCCWVPEHASKDPLLLPFVRYMEMRACGINETRHYDVTTVMSGPILTKLLSTDVRDEEDLSSTSPALSTFLTQAVSCGVTWRLWCTVQFDFHGLIGDQNYFE